MAAGLGVLGAPDVNITGHASLSMEVTVKRIWILWIWNGINSQADMDLMDMVNLAKQNEGYQYLLVCIKMKVINTF